MLYDDLIPVPIEVFGGYCPAMPPSDLPPGGAAMAQDCVFPQGALRQRGGLKPLVWAGTQISAGAKVNGLKTYITPTLAQRLLIWDSLGELFKENPQGTLSLINSRPYQNLFAQSQTLFGREYQAFFNALGGFDIPRQYDDTNWDRVSQSGPGASPAVTDETLSFAIVASPTGITQGGNTVAIVAISETADLVTVQTGGYGAGVFNTGDPVMIAGAPAGYNGTFTIVSAPDGVHVQFINPVTGLAPGAGGTARWPLIQVNTVTTPQLVAGQQATITGAGVAGYNTTFHIFSVNAGAKLVFFVPTAAQAVLANSGNGQIAASGNIVAGEHQVSVAFITRQGLITEAAPPSSWVAAGSLRAVIAMIPTGPSNVVGRLLMFTPVITPPATTGNFYSLPNGNPQIFSSTMVIPDNVTTTVSVDFLDSVLIAGFSANYLFSQVELGESAFTIGYNSRTVWMGERAKQGNFVNLGFDGGFGTDPMGNKFPLGWTEDPAFFAGAAVGPSEWDTDAGGMQHPGLSGGAGYAVIGDGATATLGKISQSAYKDYLGVPIIQPNIAYSVRVRLASTLGATSGMARINLQSTTGAFTTAGLAVPTTQLLGHYQEFIAALTDVPLVNPPADLKLQVYVDGTPDNGLIVEFDSIEVFPTLTPYNYSTARISHAFNPESFDGTTGQVQIRPGDGQQLRAGFPLRNNLYLAKDHYLGYVADDGVNEPANWAFNEVSATIGICGPNAVDWNEEWAVFAERSGLYICWGSDPVKITQEIQYDAANAGRPTWQSINWSAAHTIWVRIDKVNKMILIGAPINGSTTPNIVFGLDYQWLMSAEEIASTPLVTFSSFTGKVLSHGRGRRWFTWSISANSMTFAERADGTAQPFFGNGAGNALVYQQVDAQTQPTDNGAAVNMLYQTYGCPASVEEQQYQLSAHRKLFGYLKFRAIGAGTLQIAIANGRRTLFLRSYTLTLSPPEDSSRPVNLHGDRFFITLQTNVAGSWAQIEKLIPCLKKDPSIVVSGVS